MQHNHVSIRLINVKMQHNYVDMQHAIIMPTF